MIIMTRDDDDGDDIHSTQTREKKKRKINSTAAAAVVVKQMTVFLPRMTRIGCGPIKLYEAIVRGSIDLLDVAQHVGQPALN